MNWNQETGLWWRTWGGKSGELVDGTGANQVFLKHTDGSEGRREDNLETCRTIAGGFPEPRMDSTGRGKNNDTWWDDWDAVRGKRWFPCSWTPSSSSCHRYDGMWSLGRKKLTWASKSEQKENWCSTSLMNWQSMENAWFESMKTRDPSSLVCNREIRVPQCESLQKKGFWGSPQGEHCGEHTHKQMSLLWRLTSLEGGWVFNSFSNCQEWDSASQDDFEKRCSPAKEMSHDQDGLWHIHSEHCWQYDAYRFKFLNDLLTQIPEGRNWWSHLLLNDCKICYWSLLKLIRIFICVLRFWDVVLSLVFKTMVICLIKSMIEQYVQLFETYWSWIFPF